MSVRMIAKERINGDMVLRSLRLPGMEDVLLDVAIEIQYGDAIIEVDSLEGAASLLQELVKAKPQSERSSP